MLFLDRSLASTSLRPSVIHLNEYEEMTRHGGGRIIGQNGTSEFSSLDSSRPFTSFFYPADATSVFRLP